MRLEGSAAARRGTSALPTKPVAPVIKMEGAGAKAQGVKGAVAGTNGTGFGSKCRREFVRPKKK